MLGVGTMPWMSITVISVLTGDRLSWFGNVDSSLVSSSHLVLLFIYLFLAVLGLSCGTDSLLEILILVCLSSGCSQRTVSGPQPRTRLGIHLAGINSCEEIGELPCP